MYSLILEEYHRGSLSVFLEKTGSDEWGQYKLKSVRIQRFTSEEKARQEYERVIHPRLARERSAKTPQAKPQNRRREPKNENR